MRYDQFLMEDITNQIIADLKKGECVWEKPWFTKNFPINAKTGKSYRGTNVWILAYRKQMNQYQSNAWLTFKQCQELGGLIKGGEHGSHICYYEPITVKDSESREEVELKTFRLLKFYVVFNLDQTVGLEGIQEKLIPKTQFERNLEAERVIVESGANIQFDDRDKAYYSPAEDKVLLPYRELFKDAEGFYETAFHELGHWTGNEKRLNRQLKSRFGDESYAMEELIAEMTGAFLSAHVGFRYRNQHAGYIQSWIKVLKNDKRALFTASAKAQAAFDFIVKKVLVEAVA
jgi:antirestriction protein ArdC